jgi:hypothetical protein
LFHEDRRTDMTKLTVAVRNFANVPKIKDGKKNETKKQRERNSDAK